MSIFKSDVQHTFSAIIIIMYMCTVFAALNISSLSESPDKLLF